MPGGGNPDPNDKPYIDVSIKGFGTNLNALQRAAQQAGANGKKWEYALVIDKDND